MSIAPAAGGDFTATAPSFGHVQLKTADLDKLDMEEANQVVNTIEVECACDSANFILGEKFSSHAGSN